MNAKLKQEFESLEKSRLALFAELDKLDSAKMNTQPAPDAWSVVQVFDHLIQAENNSVLYIKKKLSFNPELKKANFNTALRLFILKAALVLPLKWRAPKIIANASNSRTYAEARQEWTNVRNALKDLLENFPEQHIDAEIFKHPVAGKFSIVQAVNFMQTHFNHHLKQVERIKKAVF